MQFDASKNAKSLKPHLLVSNFQTVLSTDPIAIVHEIQTVIVSGNDTIFTAACRNMVMSKSPNFPCWSKSV